jgi:hypothetical protein
LNLNYDKLRLTHFPAFVSLFKHFERINIMKLTINTKIKPNEIKAKA